MAAKKKGLGRGLDALMSSSASPASGEVGGSAPGVTEVPSSQIEVNPFQPREQFDEEGLEELTASIREMGVLTPLLVRRKKTGTGYQLVAGERRFRASQRAGLKKVPVLIRDLSDQESLEIALVENLQRRDLNVIEEAEGYQKLAEDFGLTQEAIATRVGKGRATVANALRLLTLSRDVRQQVSSGKLSAGHAKALLGLEIPEEQDVLARQAVKEKWSVRETERQVRKRLNPSPRTTAKAGKSDIPPDHLALLTDQLHQKFGTKVRLQPTQTLANGNTRSGKLEIEFYSNDDLDRVLNLLGLSDQV
jgi:ParB family chromosome partitioning protein